MPSLGNSPSKHTVLPLEAGKSFAFGVRFLRAADDTELDLTGCTVRFVLAQPKHKGGAVLLTKTATLLEPELGVTQVAFQASELALAEGEYPFTLTLVSAQQYSTVVMKGTVAIQANTDATTSNTYTDINTSTSLAAYVNDGGQATIVVDKVDGMYVVVSALLAEANAAADAALLSAENAEQSETAALNYSNQAAGNAALAEASQDAATASSMDAAAAASAASASQTAAAGAATSASGAAGNAALSADEAAAAALAAGASATAAAGSATAADGSADAAEVSRLAAEAAAAQAEAIAGGDLDDIVAANLAASGSATNDAAEALIGSTAPAAHNHDDRYYTETEIDGMLAGLPVGGHNHDDRYYTETETDALLAGKSGTSHTHSEYSSTSHTHSEYAGTAHTHDDRYFTESESTATFAPKVNAQLSGTTEIGASDSDVLDVQALEVETHQRNIQYTYTDGELTLLEERVGTTVVRTITYNYTAGELTSTVEVAAGKTITTTYSSSGGVLNSVTRSVA